MTNSTSYNFSPIADFSATREGATRLFYKGMKLINRYANIHLNAEDTQDGISAVYLAVIEHVPGEVITPLAELSQAYFGIASREQFRAGYNALQKLIYAGRTSGTPEYSQEYGLDGTAAKDEHAEIELDLTLQAIMSEQFHDLLEYKLQGYSVGEIAEITGIPKRTVERHQAAIKEILKSTFNVDTEGRKIPRIRK